MHRRHDDDEIEIEGELPPLLPEGDYDAICVCARKRFMRDRWTLELTFRIVSDGPGSQVELFGYCNLGDNPYSSDAALRLPSGCA